MRNHADYKKIRLHGPPTGGGISRWKSATTQPMGLSARTSLIGHLFAMREAGQIGQFYYKVNSGSVSLWIGQVAKRNRPPCGAATRKGTPCKAKAIPGKGKCRMHGGLSTGPKTDEGRERIRESNRRRGAAIRAARASEQSGASDEQSGASDEQSGALDSV